MKTLFLLIPVTLFADALFDKQITPVGLEELWTVTETINTPESVYYHAPNDTFYISNVAGAADQKDGKGWISTIHVKDGKPTAKKWVEGFHAPKGIRVHGDTLWVSDIDRIWSVSLKDGKKTLVDVEGAKFLNDVATAPDGRVFVSDTMGTKIYVVKDGKAQVFAEGEDLESPNGLLIDGDRLIVGAWGLTTDFSTKTPGRLYWLDLKTRKKHLITKKPTANLDGLEMDSDGSFIASDWKAGTVFRISPKGQVTPIVGGFNGAADIGYVPATRMLVIPRMGDNKVTAYRLPKG